MASTWTGALANRCDDVSGTNDGVGYVQAPGGERLFVVRHQPADAGPRAVVVCPSICNDFLVNYRREVVLARTLAGRGIDTVRFHYRGTGNSDGADEALSFDSMVDDLTTVIERVVDPAAAVTLVATRFSGVVAAAAAARRGIARLALVEPTTGLDRFFKEAWRARHLRTLTASETSNVPAPDLHESLGRQGWVDILGFAVHQRLVASAAGRSLVDELGPEVGDVLVYQFGGRSLRPDLVRLAEALRTRDVRVTTEVNPDTQAWWVLDDVARNDGPFVDRVTDWVTA
ncbi:MAG: alpha/beta hydrolase [Acidimicrobiia bacterium]|jgi:pimeloyl-ACP methyl ester carboxylesterase|nr:alpha/beta hydrolase [Acidimicrobiia bacterium]